MDKNELVKRYAGAGAETEDKLVLARILDKLEACEHGHMLTYTRFLNERQRMLAERMLAHVGAGNDIFYGGYDGALRTVPVFLPDYILPEQVSEEEYTPLAYLRATYTSEKRLSHRDFLGSMMACGIQRGTVGDILPGEGSCDLIVMKEIAAYLLLNFDAAGKVKLDLSYIEREELRIPQEDSKQVRDTVASLRLDNILSAGFQISREMASEAVRAGRVTLNHVECSKPDKPIAVQDRISLRGMGKIELEEIGKLTKKGRTAVVIKRYL